MSKKEKDEAVEPKPEAKKEPLQVANETMDELIALERLTQGIATFATIAQKVRSMRSQGATAPQRVLRFIDAAAAQLLGGRARAINEAAAQIEHEAAELLRDVQRLLVNAPANTGWKKRETK